MVMCKVPKKNEKIMEATPTDKKKINIIHTPNEGF